MVSNGGKFEMQLIIHFLDISEAADNPFPLIGVYCLVRM